jgi:hypothetical protein
VRSQLRDIFWRVELRILVELGLMESRPPRFAARHGTEKSSRSILPSAVAEEDRGSFSPQPADSPCGCSCCVSPCSCARAVILPGLPLARIAAATIES